MRIERGKEKPWRWILNVGEILGTVRIHVLRFPPLPDILEARICTGRGLPVPVPPQLLQRLMPVPLQVPQPISLSDHFVHRHGTFLEPLQVAHRNPPAIGFCSSASIIDLIAHALASAPNPCTTCIATPGDMPPLFLNNRYTLITLTELLLSSSLSSKSHGFPQTGTSDTSCGRAYQQISTWDTTRGKRQRQDFARL
jgi:hypothetical protein